MSNLVTDLLKKQLTDQFYSQASEKLGLNGKQGRKLVDQALPTLLGGLTKNTKDKKGATALLEALKSQKHDGRILDPNEDFFADHNLDEGDKILKHILGDTRDEVVEALASESGADASQAKKTLQALSPLVMGSLGKVAQSQKLNTDELGKMLNLVNQKGGFSKVAHRIAVLMWDKDQDGQVKDDLFEAGKNWLSGLLSKKK